jgi:hypothetical protein
MTTLFDIPPTEPVKPVNRCNHCIHLYKHEYNDTKYCRKQKGKNTSYGHKKIKANDAACPLFEKENKI